MLRWSHCLFLYRRRARTPHFFHTSGDQSDWNDYDGDNGERNVENDEGVKDNENVDDGRFCLCF